MSHTYGQQVELDMPFRVDAEGRIGSTSDPARHLRNHVVAIICTELGERVMRPGYGTNLQAALFDGDDDMQLSILQSDIRRAIQVWEKSVFVQDVSLSADNELDGIVEINVTYSAVNSPLQTVQIPVNTAVLYRGGAVEEERSG